MRIIAQLTNHLSLLTYHLLNVFYFKYIIGNIFIVDIAAVYLLDSIYNPNCHRKDNNLVHRFQHDLDSHHYQQFRPGNDTTKSNRKEDKREEASKMEDSAKSSVENT